MSREQEIRALIAKVNADLSAITDLDASFDRAPVGDAHTLALRAMDKLRELESFLAASEPGETEVGDNDIFCLACKLVDTASSDRKMYWIPVLSQLCEAVRKQDAQLAAIMRGETATSITAANQPIKAAEEKFAGKEFDARAWFKQNCRNFRDIETHIIEWRIFDEQLEELTRVSHQATSGAQPWLYAIEQPNGAWHDGEQCVFGDAESAQDEVNCLNDDLGRDESLLYKVIPLYRVAQVSVPTSKGEMK